MMARYGVVSKNNIIVLAAAYGDLIFLDSKFRASAVFMYYVYAWHKKMSFKKIGKLMIEYFIPDDDGIHSLNST
jgi:hypothetical protein